MSGGSVMGYNGRRTVMKIFLAVVALTTWTATQPLFNGILKYSVLNIMSVQNIIALTAAIMFIWIWRNWA